MINKAAHLFYLDITHFQSVSGGDINDAYKLKTKNGDYFLKVNKSKNHHSILNSEFKALQYFEENSIPSPKVHGFKSKDAASFLLMEYYPSVGNRNHENLAAVLIKLHQMTHTHFGWNEENCIGSLAQPNGWYEDFSSYFWESRLEPQLKMARDNGYTLKYSESTIVKKLNNFPSEKPTLIHGDLWNGNVLYPENQALLIDPSINFGNREMDIAMMQLFGGFHLEVLKSYNQQLPLQKGWQERQAMFQLYYMLVHLNIFGFSYLGSVQRLLSKVS